MLELPGVSAADRDHAAVHVQLADDGHPSFELGSEGLRGAAAQAQQADQDVLLWVFIGQEGLPAAVSHIVPPDQLHLRGHVCEGVRWVKSEIQNALNYLNGLAKIMDRCRAVSISFCQKLFI